MRATATLLTAVVSLTLLAACTGDGEPTDSASSKTAEQAKCTEESPLKVKEQGWSVMPGSAKPKTISFAAVVENSSDTVTVTNNGAVTVSFLDSKGEKLGYGDPGTDASQTFSLSQVQPGAQTAISGSVPVAERPDKLDIVATGACVLDADAAPSGEIAVDKADISIDGGEFAAELSVESTMSKKHDGDPVVVFRDENDEIVGGGPYNGVSGAVDPITSIPDGESKQKFSMDVGASMPETADPKRSSVFIRLTEG